jgi:uncharacterized protein YcbK (DUF882 family)
LKAGYLAIPMIDRRQLLIGSAAAVTLRSPPVWALTGIPQLRAVKIVFVPTGEKYEGFYYRDGNYVMSEVQQFSWTCRDYRANQWKWLHPHLLDLVFLLHWKYHKDEIQILSGYRAPETNETLERNMLNEQHIQGKALDLRIPDINSEKVTREFGPYFTGGTEGGISAFPTLNFIHFDFGPLKPASTERLNQNLATGPDTIKMAKSGDLYTVPVLLNRTISLNFLLDSGASNIFVPPSVLEKLLGSGTVSEADFIGNNTLKLADGSIIKSPRFYLRELIVGNQVVRNIEANLGPESSSLLLGQSFLSNFAAWTVDNSRHVLILTPRP